MNQNYSRRSLLLWVMVALTFFTWDVQAQVKVYANSVTSSSNVDNQNLSVDGSLITNASIRASSGAVAGVGAYSGTLELQFPSTLPANTTSYVKLEVDADILSPLLGGSLGVLVSGVAETVLLGGQQFTVEVKNGSTSIITAQSWDTSDFQTQQLRVVADATGNYYLMITPNASYNRIRITNQLGALIGINNVKRIDVYGAFYYQGNANCSIGTYTSYSSTGITLSLLDEDTEVANPENAIDNSSSTYSELKTGILGVAASVQQSVYFEGASSASDEYDIKLGVPSSLLTADILDNISIIAYNGQAVTQSYNAAALIDADLLGILQSGQPITLTIAPGVTDRIVVRLATLATATVTQNLNLYSVVKNDFSISVTGGGSYLVGETATITATANGCNGPYTYTWSGDITATGQTITPPTDVPGTYTFRVTVTDAYGITKFQDVQIIVEAPPVGGVIQESQTICAGTLAADLTLTGYTGNIIRWEKSFDDDFTSAEIIADTDATITGEQIGAVNQTTYIRAVVGNANYTNVYSEVVVLSVNATTWDGNSWSNGVPDINTTIYITGNYNEDVDLQGCSLNIDNNAVVVIPSGRTATIQYAVTVSSGSCIIENNANLVQISNAANSGNITVNVDSNELFRLDYTIWSSPVSGQELKAFSPFTLNDRFFIYSALINGYVSVNPVGEYFQTGIGYLIRMPNQLASLSDPNFTNYNNGTYSFAFNGQFTGVPNNGDMDITISSQGERISSVGNPYPSPIGVEDFFTENASNLEPGEGLVFWRKRNNHAATSYAVLTLEGYVANPATGGNPGEDQYGGQQWETYFNNTPVSQWVIRQGQGFVIKAAEGTTALSFTNAMRRGAYNTPFWRTAQNNERSRIWLNLESPGNDAGRMALSYSQNGTTGIDYARDARALDKEVPVKLYSVNNNDKFILQALPPFTADDIVPVGYKVETAANYTFSLYNKDGVFAVKQNVYLKDNLTGAVTNISQNNYEFFTEAGEFNNRFEIIYQTDSLNINDNDADSKNILVYNDESVINIKASGQAINAVNVFDVRGALLYNVKNLNTAEYTISGLSSQQQLIIINITTNNGTVTKKIVL